MTDEEERSAITAAMHRLLAGKPLRSSGALDVVTLAAEARLKRNKLTHKHKDLKDLFYAEVKARNGIPASEARLHEEIATLKARDEALRQERDDYRTATETFARAIHAPSRTTTSARNWISVVRPPSPRCRRGGEPRDI